jgi:hypothetical protein
VKIEGKGQLHGISRKALNLKVRERNSHEAVLIEKLRRNYTESLEFRICKF